MNQRLGKLVNPNGCDGHQTPKYKKWFKVISLSAASPEVCSVATVGTSRLGYPLLLDQGGTPVAIPSHIVASGLPWLKI
jgi:hypothetical protein